MRGGPGVLEAPCLDGVEDVLVYLRPLIDRCRDSQTVLHLPPLPPERYAHEMEAAIEAGAEDVVTNVFHFHRDPPIGIPDFANLLDIVEDFYSAIPTGDTGAVAGLLGSSLSGDFTFDVYSLDDPTPRVPVASRTGTISNATSALPREVALALSFQGATVAGEPQARRRGRVYIGPLSAAVTVIDTATGVPAAAALTRIQRAGRDMLAAANASIDWTWGVESPTLRALATGPESFTPIQNGWVDNAFDTQRRRGERATARQLWTATTP